jgi:hypothetical protein
MDCSEYAHVLAYHEKSDYYQELDQEFSRYMGDPSYFQDNDRYAQPQPNHRGDFPTPKTIISKALIGVHNSRPVIARENFPTPKTVNCRDQIQVKQNTLT